MITFTAVGDILYDGPFVQNAPAPSLERLRWLFLENPPRTRREERWFILHAKSDDGRGARLDSMEYPGLGIALGLTIGSLSADRGWWRSVGDPALLEDVFDARDDEFAARGMFIPVEKAWLAVEDFMNSRFEKSKRIEWVSGDDYPGVPDWMRKDPSA